MGRRRSVSEAALDAAIDLELGDDRGFASAVGTWLIQRVADLDKEVAGRAAACPAMICTLDDWLAGEGKSATVADLRDRLAAVAGAGLRKDQFLSLHAAMARHERDNRDWTHLWVDGPLMVGDGV